MKPDASKEASRWLRQAREDLADARYAMVGGRWHLACFLAQQSAEKAIKAFLYAQSGELVRGHSVAELCGEAARIDQDFTALKIVAGPLDRFYIPTRYPDSLPGGIPAEAFTAADAEGAARAAELTVERVTAKIAPAENEQK
ncbi:MAG: HEPN domain-containing protein [Myxococcota bacterium]